MNIDISIYPVPAAVMIPAANHFRRAPRLCSFRPWRVCLLILSPIYVSWCYLRIRLINMINNRCCRKRIVYLDAADLARQCRIFTERAGPAEGMNCDKQTPLPDGPIDRHPPGCWLPRRCSDTRIVGRTSTPGAAGHVSWSWRSPSTRARGRPRYTTKSTSDGCGYIHTLTVKKNYKLVI